MAACGAESAPTELIPTQAPLPTATMPPIAYPCADCAAANGHAGPVTDACTADANSDRDPRAYAVTHRHPGADANPCARA